MAGITAFNNSIASASGATSPQGARINKAEALASLDSLSGNLTTQRAAVKKLLQEGNLTDGAREVYGDWYAMNQPRTPPRRERDSYVSGGGSSSGVLAPRYSGGGSSSGVSAPRQSYYSYGGGGSAS